jgi:hypothetical protein
VGKENRTNLRIVNARESAVKVPYTVRLGRLKTANCRSLNAWQFPASVNGQFDLQFLKNSSHMYLKMRDRTLGSSLALCKGNSGGDSEDFTL